MTRDEQTKIENENRHMSGVIARKAGYVPRLEQQSADRARIARFILAAYIQGRKGQPLSPIDPE